MAHKIAAGWFLSSNEFSGGQESNSFLESRGFQVVECDCGGTVTLAKRSTRTLSSTSSKAHPRQPTTHSERCPECKIRVRQLLERIYGTCHSNYSLPWSTQAWAYKGTLIFNTLHRVLSALMTYRGYNDFIRSGQLPPCDFFVPDPGFLVEFDESQHFTIPRKIALSLYPHDSNIGFSIDRWISLCDRHNAKDDNPPYRDEQRAWYDTLRDLIPSIHGLKPTIRLYAAEMEWCSLDPQNAEDVKTFQMFLEEHTFIEQAASASTRTKTVSGYLEGQLRRNLSSAVATVLTEVWGEITDGDRDCLIQDVLAHVVTKTQGPVVIVFPAGFYRGSAATDLFSRIGKKVAYAIKAADPDGQVCVCLGLDGLDNRGRAADQLVVAISSRGPEAAGKKFYPTKDEKQFVNLGKPERGEFGLERVLRWPLRNGSTFYLAACYDGYGIGKGATGTQKPADAVLELIHGFDPPPGVNSGVGYYPRGLARASQNWNCPVFSAASFRNRYLSRDFPSGLWVQGWTEKWNAWKYRYNKMSPPDDRFELTQSRHLRALVQIWNAF